MKIIIIGLFLLFSAGYLNAQEITEQEVKLEKPNFVKINLLTLFTGKYAVEYERLLNKKIAVGVAIAFRPESKFPFKSQIVDLVDDDEINVLVDGMKTSGRDITPEVKFYLSKNGFGRGFYLAPYVKFAEVGFTIPYTYDLTIEYQGNTVYDRQESIELKGDMRTVTAGVSAGFNFKLTKNLFLDWKIIGPGYGSIKGDVLGKMALSAEEQFALNYQLGDLKRSLNDLPVKIDIDYEVHGNGVDIKVNKSPWANIRSGLSIAYRF